MIIDVHTHFFPPGYLEALRRGPEPYAFGRDAEGRTLLTLHGARIVTLTREMTAPEDRLRDMERFGVDLQIVSVTTPNVYFGPPARRPWRSRSSSTRCRRRTRTPPSHAGSCHSWASCSTPRRASRGWRSPASSSASPGSGWSWGTSAEPSRT